MTTTNKWATLENTDENCTALAERVVEFWEMDTLIDFAVGVLAERYRADKAVFQADAENEEWDPEQDIIDDGE